VVTHQLQVHHRSGNVLPLCHTNNLINENKIAVKFLIYLYEIVSKIFKLTRNYVRNCICLSVYPKIGESTTGRHVSNCLISRQHQLMSIHIFCRILLHCPCSSFVQNVIISSVGGSDHLPQTSSNSIQFSCIAKVILMSRADALTYRSWDRPGRNIMPPLQHGLHRHKNYFIIK